MTVAATATRLTAEQVRRRCDPQEFPFETTAELKAGPGLLGQARAADALAFGLAMSERSFNVFVAGPPGVGKSTAVQAVLQAAARGRATPPDLCYVHNFRDPSRPRMLQLAAGQGRRLRDALHALVQAARREIPRAFESEEYAAQREAIAGDVTKRREEAQTELAVQAQKGGFQLQPTPTGLAIIPIIGGRQVSDEELAGLPAQMRETFARGREELEVEIRGFFKVLRALEREMRDRLSVQDREVATHAVGGLVEDLAEHYEDQPVVLAYLDEIREGILGDIALFRSHPLLDGDLQPQPEPNADGEHALHERAFRKYEFNVAVDNGDLEGAPVVVERNPTYPNLIGRVEREVLFGALVTDFTLIAAGALQRANGGYLVLHADDLLRAPLSWDALKRCLREGHAAIEDAGDTLGLTSTRGLRPDPTPLDLKVFLIGEPAIYQALYALDPGFRELFKVRADFDVVIERTPENEIAYLGLVAGPECGHALPLDRGGAARLIEESSRLAEDQRKLTARLSEMLDLVREAEYWASAQQAAAINGDHVRRAVEGRSYRSALIPERMRELVARGILLVRPEGEAVGEVNGLAVVGLGDSAFGHPSRISASVAAGREGVIDIERQVAMGGPIHSKGVLILSGYLADTYARDKPLALAARLVFEQSYEGVEGDSASMAELLALLSRLADVPLRQDFAVTGSINQRGEVQAIGGANEKVEGFFDTCVTTGLSGEQGVILPAANVENLMLRDDIVEAVAAGRFRILAVANVDQAIEALSGLPAAEVHARVNARLRSLAEALSAFTSPEARQHIAG
jgi:predicted ATP-dependent protease